MLKDFIVKIQESDETTKARWVWGASAATMLLVIILWIAYLDISTPRGATSTRAEPGVVLASADLVERENSARPGFFKTLSAGVSIVFDQAKKKLYYSHTQTIEGEANVGDIFEPIPPTKLP